LVVQSLAQQLQVKRSEMMSGEVEAVALRLFERRGFGEVTVEEIAGEAHISARTFYRYFPVKEDLLQLRIERRVDALRRALDARPSDEPPLHSLRLAVGSVVAEEDLTLLRQWMAVVAAAPNLLKGVLGGIQLKSHRMLAEFFADRLRLPIDALVPTVLAAAASGVIQSVQTNWYVEGGDLAAALVESLAVLDRGISTDPGAWAPTG
jgi:TetR/AcrR family transcriptional regulator, regulator of mycofactocin system